MAGVGLTDFYARQSGLRVTRPGYFDSLDGAMAWMRAEGVTHLAVDDESTRRRPCLEALLDQRTRPSCIDTIDSGVFARSAWPQRFFEIRWAACTQAVPPG